MIIAILNQHRDVWMTRYLNFALLRYAGGKRTWWDVTKLPVYMVRNVVVAIRVTAARRERGLHCFQKQGTVVGMKCKLQTREERVVRDIFTSRPSPSPSGNVSLCRNVSGATPSPAEVFYCVGMYRERLLSISAGGRESGRFSSISSYPQC